VITQSKGGDAGRAAPGVGYEANFPDHPSALPAQPAPLCQVIVIPFVDLWNYLEAEGLEVDYGNHNGELWLKNKGV